MHLPVDSNWACCRSFPAAWSRWCTRPRQPASTCQPQHQIQQQLHTEILRQQCCLPLLLVHPGRRCHADNYSLPRACYAAPGLQRLLVAYPVDNHVLPRPCYNQWLGGALWGVAALAEREHADQFDVLQSAARARAQQVQRSAWAAPVRPCPPGLRPPASGGIYRQCTMYHANQRSPSAIVQDALGFMLRTLPGPSDPVALTRLYTGFLHASPL